ncbi:hypothetical protein D9M68_342710 [compost metagenome]
MSTVLWANELVGGVVTSDESDKYALYKHADKLDEIGQRIAQKSFKALCDTTDLEFNLGDDELPNGMASTNELMAKNGKWMTASEAVSLLSSLIAEIETKKVRFGLLKNDHDAVLTELKESLSYAQGAAAKGGKFNFSVVM